ncbi:pilus assembly protein [Roseomonas sp. NAR14]|uniref:Pilus assembly protein n=1 Tax=Roseomonas acroporae TaxID=2937791 RepID=A0A9X1Y7U5_9PROT|nr:AAA family ATPase [Roseomonas acroporae]MCK8785749.1 pilus assembly protein [Roseomonas acroporae]
MAAEGSSSAQGSTGGRERPSLLVFVDDADSEAALREVLLDKADEGAEVRRGNIQAAAKALRRGATPRALVVDVSGLSQPLSALEELAQVVEPDVRVLAIGDRTDAAFYRQVTRGMGVLEYLHKPLGRDIVARHFMPLLQGGAEPGNAYLRGGRVIVLAGVRGGAGATTVAGNLAWYLAEKGRGHTVLLDCDLQAGGAALLLGARTSSGLRVALEHPDRVDELFVERTAQPVNERLCVLAGEEKVAEAAAAVPGALARLVAMLRRRFNFVVVDLPARSGALTGEMLDLAHQRVLISDATLAGTRELLRFAALPNAPQQAGRPVLVVNRFGQPGTLGRGHLRQALGEEPGQLIPWLPRQVSPAADLGEPAAARRGGFRDAIARLAHETASIGESRSAGGGGLLSRLFR